MLLDSNPAVIAETCTVNALYNLASCGRAYDRILAWANSDLSVECFKRVDVRAWTKINLSVE